MRLINNVIGLGVYNSMKTTNKKLGDAMNKLSTGYQINSVKDDSAGFAIAKKLERQALSTDQASRNSTDGISILETADGALTQIQEMLQRMRELAVQASNDSLTNSDKRNAQMEIESLKEEIDGISKKTDFNTINMLAGEAARMAKPVTAADAAIGNVSYISNSMPSGIFSFDVANLATQATTSTTYNSAKTASVDGKIYINSTEVEILKTDTATEIKTKIQEALNDSYLILDNSGTITSERFGTASKIEISSSNDTLMNELFGTSSISVKGTDAVLNESNTIMYGTDGVTPLTSFNNSATFDYDGNTVKISSSNGQEITLNVKSTGTGKSNLTDQGLLVLQVGTHTGMEMDIFIPKTNVETLGITYTNISNKDNASEAITEFNDAISMISETRSNIGAYINRLEFTVKTLDVASTTTQSSLSRIRDTDMAKEMSEYTKQNVLYQAANSMMAQANQIPQSVLQLLQ